VGKTTTTKTALGDVFLKHFAIRIRWENKNNAVFLQVLVEFEHTVVTWKSRHELTTIFMNRMEICGMHLILELRKLLETKS
jgi:hypothetical protein